MKIGAPLLVLSHHKMPDESWRIETKQYLNPSHLPQQVNQTPWNILCSLYRGERQPMMDYCETVTKEIRPQNIQLLASIYGSEKNVVWRI